MDARCQICRRNIEVLKRCTRCCKAYYCSRSCQVKDWPLHKDVCESGSTNTHNDTENVQDSNASSFGMDCDVDTTQPTMQSSQPSAHPTCQKGLPTSNLDIQTAALSLSHRVPQENSNVTQATDVGQKEIFIAEENTQTDIKEGPSLEQELPVVNITVKYNKCRQQVSLQTQWSGLCMMTTISDAVCIPLQKLKLMHRGKLLSKDSIAAHLTPRAVFMAIGEQEEDASGIEACDIDIIMKQLGVDRNTAVKALHKNTDVVDAILEISNSK